MRIHAQARNSLWFGPARGQPRIHRFDDTAGRFRVGYFGTTLEVCFAETFLRNPPVRILALDDIAGRSVATVEVRRDLRLVPVHGSSLARLGVTAEVATGGDCALSQLSSRVLWEHSDQPDGILYRSRHDDSALCVALFDRAKDALAVVGDCSLAEDSKQLARLLRRYGLALTN
jgi:RES domain